jgi:pyrroline-5-carboxylate reductase
MLCLATLCRQLVLLALLVLHSPAFATDAMADLSNKCVGFLGCGKISSAVCRGYAGASGASRPGKILVSQRSAEKSQALAAAYPGLVTIASNEEVVAQSDIVFIGLLPGVARELLPTLPFDDKKLVVSMMAAVDLAETMALVGVAPERLVRTVPLPAAANRSGPVLVHPPNQELEAVLRVVGTPVVCVQEAEMKPMVSLTGHISSFFELMNATQDFIVENGTYCALCCFLMYISTLGYTTPPLFYPCRLLPLPFSPLTPFTLSPPAASPYTPFSPHPPQAWTP